MEPDLADPNFADFRPYSAIKFWLSPIFRPRDYAGALRHDFIGLLDMCGLRVCRQVAIGPGAYWLDFCII